MGKSALSLLIPLALIALAACGSTDKNAEWAGTCPTSAVLSEASTLTRFKPGVGKDPTDVVLRGEMHPPELHCDYDKESGKVEVGVSFPIIVTRGPAASDSSQSLSYFVAVVDTDNNVVLKKGYTREITLEQNATSLNESPEDAVFTVAKDKKPVAYEVLVGFQLTQDELAYNRERHRYMP